jgi:hypothetical protein
VWEKSFLRRSAFPGCRSAHQLAIPVALAQCKQIVIPFAICVRAKIWVLKAFANYADINLAIRCFIHRVEGLLLGVNPADCLLARQAPIAGHVSDVSYVFVGTRTVGFIDASDFVFFHIQLLAKGTPVWKNSLDKGGSSL